VVGLIGQGGGGAVYRCDDLRLDGRVTAVKQVLPEPGQAAEVRAAMREQFQREAETLARLDHPALTKVSDFFAENGADYLVMDFVDGPDLRRMVDDARAEGRFLDESEVLSWAAQLLDVVGYLHAQDPPVLHRDIKPSNIKLVAGGRLKLVDFGLVKPMDQEDPRTLTAVRGVGSLPYTPLEQYAGDTGHTAVNADLYSIGATLYHLLTGKSPATAQERFLMPNALERPAKLNPGISPRTEAAVLQAMALHPSRRPASVDELRDALLGSGPLATDPDLIGRPDVWRDAVWDNLPLLALAALLLVLAALATWQAMP
jgi:serine/threonine-protein kinase